VNEGPQAREPEFLDGIADRLREERVRADLSQRELARRLGLSPSLISQLENGQSRPSVGTLYAIVTELGISLDRLIRGDDEPGAAGARERAPVLRSSERATIDLDSGVRWEELADEDGVDFLLATYEVGGASTSDDSLIRHQGREYGYILKGRLHVRIGFRDHELGPGDSIAFDSTTPHRLENRGDEPVEAIWFVVGRDADRRTDGGPSGGPV
jgi:transcriptional regulator with XRE-family HTH domain